jgi:hypothetical protein
MSQGGVSSPWVVEGFDVLEASEAFSETELAPNDVLGNWFYSV